jgi:3-hydroxypropanoate dehydrogenase
MPALPDFALDQLFGDARTFNRFAERAIDDATIERLYAELRLGPTGFNAQPARFVFIRSAEAKAKLEPALSSSNRQKTIAAPLNVIVAWDTRFHDHLPTQFLAYDARSYFETRPDAVAPAGITNATLQAGYLILAARALGLDVGPMSGFDAAAVDAAFFPAGDAKSLLLLNLGYGLRDGLTPRGPRLDFATAARIV